MSRLYKKSGVDVIKTDKLISQALKFIKSSHNDKVLGNKLGFSAEYRVNKDVTLCAATDGVGTKAILAAELNDYKGIGQDLVAMCSNDLLCNKAKPLFFLDYFACSSVKSKQYTEILRSITGACKRINCSLIGGETAEMPNHYTGKNFDLAGFSVGVVEKKLIISPSKVKKNNIIVGIESSGAHSNGYSLINKLIQESRLNESDRSNIIEFALKPTYLYTSVILDLVKKVEVKSIANITGGGLTENIPRSIPNTLSSEIYLDNWKIPSFFKTLQELGNIEKSSMLKIFNCGIGMTVIVEPKDLNKTLDVLSKHKFKGYMIGKVINEASSKIKFV